MWVKLCLGLLLLFVISRITRKKRPNPNIPHSISEDFKEVFEGKGFYMPNWLAVSAMETNGFDSNLFLFNNNPVGMNYPTKRVTTATGKTWRKGGGYWASYPNVKDGILDIILWADYTKFPPEKMSIEKHVFEMKKRGFFQEPESEYLKAVKQWV